MSIWGSLRVFLAREQHEPAQTPAQRDARRTIFSDLRRRRHGLGACLRCAAVLRVLHLSIARELRRRQCTNIMPHTYTAAGPGQGDENGEGLRVSVRWQRWRYSLALAGLSVSVCERPPPPVFFGSVGSLGRQLGGTHHPKDRGLSAYVFCTFRSVC